MLQVEEIEGRTIAIQHSSQFYEVSVAENTPSIYTAFDMVLSECRALQATQKTRKFSVSKMIGTLIGNTNGKVPPTTSQGGTVVVCHKSDLYKSRILKRRQNFIATASLWLSESSTQEGTVRWRRTTDFLDWNIWFLVIILNSLMERPLVKIIKCWIRKCKTTLNLEVLISGCIV